MLAILTSDDSAFDATLSEFNKHPDDTLPTVKFLAGLAAGVWGSARGPVAVTDVTRRIAGMLDAKNPIRKDRPE